MNSSIKVGDMVRVTGSKTSKPRTNLMGKIGIVTACDLFHSDGWPTRIFISLLGDPSRTYNSHPIYLEVVK